jgi:hypothetical protein
VASFAIAVPDAEDERDDARIDEVSIREGGLGNEFLEGCVLAVFSELSFEPPADGRIEVNYPLRFRKAEPPPEAASP